MDSLHTNPMMRHLIEKLERDTRDEIHSIMGMLELIAEGPLTDSQYAQLRTCRSSADRALRTIQNVYEFACPEEGNPGLEQIDLQEVVSDTVCLMEELARRKGLNFRTTIGSDTPAQVRGDRHRLDDVLVRLIDNSIRFTDKGWIELALARCAKVSGAPGIDFIVSDSGPGIPEDTIIRAMNPAAPEHFEDGLGLPIVHQLVREMGGELSLCRMEGGGSRVTVSLPFQILEGSLSPEAGVTDRTDGQSAEPVRPMNILIAEDSDQSYYVIESYLDGQGHQLTRAANGSMAVDTFKRGAYDLVLMDVHMPLMDGYAATRAIREWETTDGRARVPIVVLSTDSLDTQRQNGAQAGCTGYITKPASKAAVLNSLKRFARGSSGD